MKKIIFNHRILFPLSIAVFMFIVALAPFVINESDIVFTIVALAISIFIFIYCATHPIVYIFDDEKLKIKYLFGFYEVILWKNIKQIETIPDGRLFHLSVLHFVVNGGSIGKKSSFTNSEVIFTSKAYLYIKQYCNNININILNKEN